MGGGAGGAGWSRRESFGAARGTRGEGAALIELDSSETRAALASAQARVTQARADLEVIEKGGRAADLSVIAGDLEREKLELAVAQKEYDSLVRLQAKQAATTYEVAQARIRWTGRRRKYDR